MQAITPRSEPSILKRARMLYPVLVRANTALAALTPAQPPVTRAIAGTVYTAVLLKGLLDDFTDVIKDLRDKESVLNTKRAAVRSTGPRTN